MFGPTTASRLRLRSSTFYSLLGPAPALPDLENYVHCSVLRLLDGSVRLLGLGSDAPTVEPQMQDFYTFLQSWGGTWMW